MSDQGFSWAPFGPSAAEGQEPLPPLDDEELTDAVAAPAPAVDFEPEPLPWEQDAPASQAPPTAAVATYSAPPPDIVPARRPRPQVTGGGDATAALVWGVLGVTLLPVLIPSIVAIRLGNRARASGSGLAGARGAGLAGAGVILGWIGVAIWTLVLLVIVAA